MYTENMKIENFHTETDTFTLNFILITFRYVDEAGALTCKLCASGKYSETIGANASSTCTQCPAGTQTRALTGVGKKEGCVGCEVGRFSDSIGSCLPCPRGRFSKAAAASQLSQCTACPAMTEASVEGMFKFYKIFQSIASQCSV